MRDPDFGSPEVMTRRGWWLVVLNVLIPGSAQILSGNRRLGRFGLGATLTMWALIVVAALTGLLWRQALLWLTIGGGWVSWVVLTLIQVLCYAYALLWIVLTFDTLRIVRLVRIKNYARIAIPLVAVLVVALCGSGAASAATIVASSRTAITTLFGSGGPSLPPSDGYYNVLLLGADSGAGRDSMRFDSISVVSVNAETGKVTIFGIPRDMPNVPFAAGPMHDAYPNGFTAHDDENCGWGAGINQLTNAVEVCHSGKSYYPDAKAHGSTPSIEATKAAAEGVLGITIPYYVFLDMNDFARLVDALGGVDMDVKERLPEGGPPPGSGAKDVNTWATGWIEPGKQHMNGDTAQWYARSRYTTSDFDRMLRQRQLQEAILKQFTPQNVLTHFSEIAKAGTAMVNTDLPQDKLPEFVDLMMKAKQQSVQAVELTPANGVDEFTPDWNQIHQMVKTALHPTPSPTPTH
ncbi:LCP family protein [Microbacterium sp. ASV81]|uniref:LCP family protein n=2 Tax=Microbacterium capsulatum TaxID=3041921 RepID=A0ABU0XMR4_9MICO|nr:LCP family protein [Microbacterium sp. ASV81]MDQ4215370.1 LCP family protein [Microbacterium sp. ASV81]